MTNQNEVRVTQRADVAVLVDATGSMQPCIDTLKSHVEALSNSLGGDDNVNVEWRAKAVGFRDLEADSVSDQFVGKDNAFISSSEELSAQLAPLTAMGGGMGIAEIPESALDALDLIMGTSDWVPIGEGHRIIILLTDAPTKPSTINGQDVHAIAQKASEGHFRMLMYGPTCPEYEQLSKLPKCAFTDVSENQTANVYEGLKNLDWQVVFETINKTVSIPVDVSGVSVPASTPAPQSSSPSSSTSEAESDDEFIEPPSDDDIIGGGGTTVPAGGGGS